MTDKPNKVMNLATNRDKWKQVEIGQEKGGGKGLKGIEQELHFSQNSSL